MEGAQSECIVPSAHPAHQNPQAIAEVLRILKLNAKLNDRSVAVKAQAKDPLNKPEGAVSALKNRLRAQRLSQTPNKKTL